MDYIFYVLAAFSVITALLVVFAKNPVHSVLYLILTFFGIAGQYLMMDAEFLAVVQIIVYAGAIMVLFLFVLMLLNLNKDNEPQKSTLVKGIATVAGGSLLLVMTAALRQSETLSSTAEKVDGSAAGLGMLLFTDFVVPFEIASILFIAAMVGAVLLGKSDKNVG
jgi:NADH-quinone oxidoreductase subunit J